MTQPPPPPPTAPTNLPMVPLHVFQPIPRQNYRWYFYMFCLYRVSHNRLPGATIFPCRATKSLLLVGLTGQPKLLLFVFTFMMSDNQNFDLILVARQGNRFWKRM